MSVALALSSRTRYRQNPTVYPDSRQGASSHDNHGPGIEDCTVRVPVMSTVLSMARPSQASPRGWLGDCRGWGAKRRDRWAMIDGAPVRVRCRRWIALSVIICRTGLVGSKSGPATRQSALRIAIALLAFLPFGDCFCECAWAIALGLDLCPSPQLRGGLSIAQ